MLKEFAKIAPLVALFSLSFGCNAYAADARTHYILGCMGCHGETGVGSEGKVPSFRNSLVPLAAMPDGRRYLVQVPGSSLSPYSDTELAELLNWMMENLSDVRVPATLSKFSQHEVAVYRTTVLRDTAYTRARLLARVSNAGKFNSEPPGKEIKAK